MHHFFYLSLLMKMRRFMAPILAGVAIGALAGCGSIDPSVLFNNGEETDGEQTPAWATVDLNGSDTGPAITEPWEVFVAQSEAFVGPGEALPEPFQIGSITPEGIFIFDVTVTPPDPFLVAFRNALAPPTVVDGREVEDAITYTPSAPEVLAIPLLNLPARPASASEFGLWLLINEGRFGDSPYATPIYSDRAADINGTLTLRRSDDDPSETEKDTIYSFDLRLEAGYNLMLISALEETATSQGTVFESTIGTTVPQWVFMEVGEPE